MSNNKYIWNPDDIEVTDSKGNKKDVSSKSNTSPKESDNDSRFSWKEGDIVPCDDKGNPLDKKTK